MTREGKLHCQPDPKADPFLRQAQKYLRLRSQVGREPLDLNRRIEPTVISKKAMFSTWKAYFPRPLCTFVASARTITGRYDDEGGDSFRYQLT
jgi:hypothetical protein